MNKYKFHIPSIIKHHVPAHAIKFYTTNRKEHSRCNPVILASQEFSKNFQWKSVFIKRTDCFTRDKTNFYAIIVKVITGGHHTTENFRESIRRKTASSGQRVIKPARVYDSRYIKRIAQRIMQREKAQCNSARSFAASSLPFYLQMYITSIMRSFPSFVREFSWQLLSFYFLFCFFYRDR